MRYAYTAVTSLLGIFLKETEWVSQRDTCTSVFFAALFKIAKIWKQPKHSLMYEWIKKVGNLYLYLYPHNGILFSYEKEENPAICDNVNKPGGHYAKWNKSDTERQMLHFLTNVWNLK